jgi:hypothetical protein
VARRVWDGRWERGRRKAMTVTEPGEKWYQHSEVGDTDENVRNAQKNWTVHLWVVDAKGNPGGASVNDFINVALDGWAMRRVGVEAILCFAIKCNFFTQDDGAEVNS